MAEEDGAELSSFLLRQYMLPPDFASPSAAESPSCGDGGMVHAALRRLAADVAMWHVPVGPSLREIFPTCNSFGVHPFILFEIFNKNSFG